MCSQNVTAVMQLDIIDHLIKIGRSQFNHMFLEFLKMNPQKNSKNKNMSLFYMDKKYI
jgi:hypothetical protein